MSWKTELDRTVLDSLRRCLDERRPDVARAVTLAADLVALCPGRPESHFALGLVEESLALRPPSAPELPAAPAPPAEAAAGAPGPAPAAPVPTVPPLPASPEGDPAIWRWLGRLDVAARGAGAERVRQLAEDPAMETAILRPREGRVALRAVSRALLSGGADGRAYDLYARHLAATGDEASRKDADALLGDAVRRAEDVLADGDAPAATAALDRALAFAGSAGLEGRAAAKVERKIGRAHQLEGRWSEAADRYRAALARLQPDDRYRSVLLGDLALASLQVRGTLDLLPKEGRTGIEEAERLLADAVAGGEGESYNALYTLGVLAYERGEFAPAAGRFRDADRLMRETRAKARIVHARARFLLGACLLRQGAAGEALAEAEDLVLQSVAPANLEEAIRQPVLDLLAAASPSARIPGRPAPGRQAPEGRPGPRARDRGFPRGGRPAAGERADRPPVEPPRPRGGPGGRDRPVSPAPSPVEGGSPPAAAAAHLAAARRGLDSDPHQALRSVDDAFKSRPSFEEWYTAYRIRLEALIRLGEKVEALRTYERFRAKLHERGRGDRLEELLLDASGPMAEVLDEVAHRAELVDLYATLPGRERAFAEACVALAAHHAAAGTPTDLRKAVSLLREAVACGNDEARARWAEVAARARAAGVSVEGPMAEDVRARLAARGGPSRVVVVGGDESSRPHAERLKDLGVRAGFEPVLVLGGARPHHRTLAEVEELARGGALAVALLHTTTPDVREAVRRLGADLGVPVREIPYAGAHSLEPEILTEIAATLPA